MSLVDEVVAHPAVQSLGRSDAEQAQVDALAVDLARWFSGLEGDDLRPLARVVTAVAQRELGVVRRLCEGEALMAIEAAARATGVLWPFLATDPVEPEDTDGVPQESQPTPDMDSMVERMNLAFSRPIRGRRDPAGQVADLAVEGAMEVHGVTRTLETLLPGLGWSVAPGRLREVLSRNVGPLSTLLGKLDALRELVDTLGRVERAAQRVAAARGGGVEVAGVRFGGSVTHAIPAELGLLAEPETEDLFYQRWLERQLVTLQLSGPGIDDAGDVEGAGPIIALVDTSGSMEGAPEIAAKALVLAICRQAIPAGRTVHLVLFGASGELVDLRLRPGPSSMEGLLAFLALGFQGGTDFDSPLRRALHLVDERPLRRADILMISDGWCTASAATIGLVQDYRRRRGVRVWSVLLGKNAGWDLEAFSDQVWVCDATLADRAAEVLVRIHEQSGRTE